MLPMKTVLNGAFEWTYENGQTDIDVAACMDIRNSSSLILHKQAKNLALSPKPPKRYKECLIMFGSCHWLRVLLTGWI